MQMRTIFKAFVLTGVALALAGFGAALGAYLYVSSSLPKVDTLADYRPPVITKVYSDDGAVIAEYYRERRILVPVSRIPDQLIEAFVAAEDASFFEHQGIDLISIFRAALKNIKAGGIVQGGSTITQQVAKSLLLTPEKKFSRKFKEAILAWRMEKKLSKEGILYLYLNQIYLGHGAYGVQAAAENYFSKNIEELTLAECAMLAGLPQAPSRYSPYRNIEGATERQKYVLGRMVQEGFISSAAAQAALSEEIQIHPRINTNSAATAYFTEQVRRYLEDAYGEEKLYTAGLEVHTSMDLTLQETAHRAVRENLIDHDRRRGYRGPLRVLGPGEVENFLSQQAHEFGSSPPAEGQLVEAVLTGGAADLEVRVGAWQGRIGAGSTRWAAPVKVVAADRPATGNAKSRETRLPLGSVLLARVEGSKDGVLNLSLAQEPLAQGAMVSLDPKTGLVRAMVGGYDFQKSQFNRAIQAKRQPGSAIKPLIYAAALDKGYTPASMILDNPLIYREMGEAGRENEWKPQNYEEKFHGLTTFRQALAHSRNVVTVKILEDIGVGYAVNYVRKLGIHSPLNRDLTLALGSSVLTPMELAKAYAVFANGGVRTTPSYITRIADRDGRILESIDPGDFPGGVGSGQRLLRASPVRVISQETAYLITNLMESVARDGTGWRAKALGRPVAVKTGTTNDLKDAWFVGFVPQLVTVSWVGYDQERPLGRNETGSKAAAPAWVAFMKDAVKDIPAREFAVPDSIIFRPIDPETGLLAPEDSSKMHIEAFAPGTAPTRYSMDERRPRAEDFFKIDLEDSGLR